MTVAAATEIATQLAAGNYGYSQDPKGRWSGIKNGKLHEPGAFDCSSSCGVIAWLGGFIDQSLLSGTWYTGNMADKLVRSGMYHEINVQGLSLTKLTKLALEGDFILGPGHVVYCLDGGRVVSFEANEHGTATGGKPGDQTGREGRIRKLYARPKGWTSILRPYTAAELARQLVDHYADTGNASESLVAKLVRRAPWDGPRWAAFLATWQGLDRGMSFAYTAGDINDVPDQGHAFVVLGGSLTDTGTIKAQFRRRLALALTAANRYGSSLIVITGGAAKAGRTEAQAGKDWLIAAGVDPARIITEGTSASTIGNARATLPILIGAKVTTYTLVSDASHLRRASVLFLAAQLGIETAHNKRVELKPRRPLAVNDYGDQPVKTTHPITHADRDEIASEVRTLLEL